MRRILDGRSRLQFPPPMWKVKRELRRIVGQFEDLVFRTTGFSIPKFYMKWFVDPRVATKKGALPLQDRVAIYMIFPAEGLLASHVMALDYIVACGYVPVVVSNLPLDDAAQATILQRSAALIFRPNFGYDFAAYRDGLKYLDRVDARPDYLAIFNDSTWFPAFPGRNWFREAEATGCDYVGSVFHNAIDPDVEWDFRKDPWTADCHFKHFHYGSFALLIGRNILISPEFKAFWRDYLPSNDKLRTVKTGEIGLTQLIVQGGFSHAATLDNQNLDELLSALPTGELVEIALNTMTPTHKKIRKVLDENSLADAPDRDQLRNFILNAVVKEGPAYALVNFDVLSRSGNFIKKSSVELDKTAGELTLNLLRQLPGPSGEVFLAEATRMYQKKHGANL